MFAIIIVIMLTVVVLFLAYPFLQKTVAPIPFGHAAAEDQERLDLEIEKESLLGSLSELEVEREQGRFTHSDYLRLKATDEKRLVQILNRLDQLSIKTESSATGEVPILSKPSSGMSWVSAITLGFLVLGSSSGIYSYLHWKEGEQRLAMERQGQGQGMPNPLEMVARLEQRLRENPNDIPGQIMAGRSYLALQRIEEARSAWSKVLELDPKNYEAHYNLGVILISTAEPGHLKNYEEALEHLNTALVKVPREPAVLWYKGVALVHLQRFSEADESWTTAFQNLAPGTEDAELVKQALQSLRAGTTPRF